MVQVPNASAFLVILLSVTATIIISIPAQATEEADSWQTLAKTRSLKCTFETAIQGDWKDGRLSTTKDRELFKLHFDSIDTENRHARLIGNTSAVDVSLALTPSGMNFLEITESGNLNFITVFPRYKGGTQEFISVLSRHLLLFDFPFPSQHHGVCIPFG